ncbi:MAG: RHS repeat-associated core domain-containing protein [Phycisphaerales bacterium JB050]
MSDTKAALNSNGTLSKNPSFARLDYALTDRNFSVIGLGFEADAVGDRVRYAPYGTFTAYPAGDVNADGTVNSADTTAILIASGYKADLDVNMDGSVDSLDSSMVSGLSGRTLTDGQLSDNDNIVGWCGYLYEESTGMWLARHRWQIPELGRWANRDPIGYAGGGQNLYEYVNGNPVFFNDPVGQFGISLPSLRDITSYWTDVAVDARNYVFGVDTEQVNRDERQLHADGCSTLRKVLARKTKYDCQTDEEWEEQHKNAHHAYYVTHKCDGPAPVTDWGDLAYRSVVETVDDALTDPTEFLDNFQLTLDAMGLIPVIGEVADGLSGVVSLFRGDGVGFGLSAAAMIPFLGNGAGAAKIARRGDSFYDAKKAAYARRAYLNSKFGRSGKLDTDIHRARGYSGGLKGVPNGANPRPPGWNSNWEWRDGSMRAKRSRWWDQNGGEWRFHGIDKHPPSPHWDYNPWNAWNDKWRNIDLGGKPI